ncbi:hypothetical protein ACOME3_000490 [Neoechinorhynchus agilis]
MICVTAILILVFPIDVQSECQILKSPLSIDDNTFIIKPILHCEFSNRFSPTKVAKNYEPNVNAIRLQNTNFVLKNEKWLFLTTVYIFSRCQIIIDSRFRGSQSTIHTLAIDSCRVNVTDLLRSPFKNLEYLAILNTGVLSLSIFRHQTKIRWLKLFHTNLKDLTMDLFDYLHSLDRFELNHEHGCNSCDHQWIVIRSKLSGIDAVDQKVSGRCRNRMTNLPIEFRKRSFIFTVYSKVN